MLPPPITVRLRRLERREFNVLACSVEGSVVPGTGVTESVPDN